MQEDSESSKRPRLMLTKVSGRSRTRPVPLSLNKQQPSSSRNHSETSVSEPTQRISNKRKRTRPLPQAPIPSFATVVDSRKKTYEPLDASILDTPPSRRKENQVSALLLDDDDEDDDLDTWLRQPVFGSRNKTEGGVKQATKILAPSGKALKSPPTESLTESSLRTNPKANSVKSAAATDHSNVSQPTHAAEFTSTSTDSLNPPKPTHSTALGNDDETTSHQACPCTISSDALLASVDFFFGHADTDTVTVRDIIEALQAEYRQTLDKSMRKMVRQRLKQLLSGKVEPSVGMSSGKDTASRVSERGNRAEISGDEGTASGFLRKVEARNMVATETNKASSLVRTEPENVETSKEMTSKCNFEDVSAADSPIPVAEIEVLDDLTAATSEKETQRTTTPCCSSAQPLREQSDAIPCSRDLDKVDLTAAALTEEKMLSADRRIADGTEAFPVDVPDEVPYVTKSGDGQDPAKQELPKAKRHRLQRKTKQPGADTDKKDNHTEQRAQVSKVVAVENAQQKKDSSASKRSRMARKNKKSDATLDSSAKQETLAVKHSAPAQTKSIPPKQARRQRKRPCVMCSTCPCKATNDESAKQASLILG